jgi:hypothetical protein
VHGPRWDATERLSRDGATDGPSAAAWSADP